MSKVLYIGNFLDGTGWSRACCDYVLALDSAGVDVVPRVLKLSPSVVNPSPRILELLKKDTDDYDVVIYHVLPSLLERHGNKKHICIFASETNDLPFSWMRKLNWMDEIWAINKSQAEVIKRSGVETPVKIVNHTINLDKYHRTIGKLPPLQDAITGCFSFYTIGEVVRRKNLTALLRAFHGEFMPWEPVTLVIKGHIPGVSPSETNQFLGNMSAEIKKGLRLFPRVEQYKKEITIPEFLSDEQILQLHSTCDCFVQASYGEAASYPLLDSMALGKPSIITNGGGYLDYATIDTSWLVDCHLEQTFGVENAPEELHTARESWWGINIRSLQSAMREAYTNRLLLKQKSQAALTRSFDFSYEQIGKQMKELL